MLPSHTSQKQHAYVSTEIRNRTQQRFFVDTYTPSLCSHCLHRYMHGHRLQTCVCTRNYACQHNPAHIRKSSCKHIAAHTNLSMGTSTHAYARTCKFLHTYMCLCKHAHMCLRTYMHGCASTHMCEAKNMVRAHMHACSCARTHTCSVRGWETQNAIMRTCIDGAHQHTSMPVCAWKSQSSQVHARLLNHRHRRMFLSHI